MALHGFIGLVIGFIIGMVMNMFLLKNVSRETMRRDKSLRLKYGGLNWLIALAGLAAGLYWDKIQ